MTDNEADADESRKLTHLRAATCAHQIAFDLLDGQKGLTLRTEMRCFSLRAASRYGADDADDAESWEQLCLHVNCPALVNEREPFHAAGHVVLKLNTFWREGVTHPAMSALEFAKLLIESTVFGRRIDWFNVCSGHFAEYLERLRLEANCASSRSHS